MSSRVCYRPGEVFGGSRVLGMLYVRQTGLLVFVLERYFFFFSQCNSVSVK